MVSWPVRRLNSQVVPRGVEIWRFDGEVCLAAIKEEGRGGCRIRRWRGVGLVSCSWPVARTCPAEAQGVCCARENSRVRCVSGRRSFCFGRLVMVNRASICGAISVSSVSE